MQYILDDLLEVKLLVLVARLRALGSLVHNLLLGLLLTWPNGYAHNGTEGEKGKLMLVLSGNGSIAIVTYHMRLDWLAKDFVFCAHFVWK